MLVYMSAREVIKCSTIQVVPIRALKEPGILPAAQPLTWVHISITSVLTGLRWKPIGLTLLKPKSSRSWTILIAGVLVGLFIVRFAQAMF